MKNFEEQALIANVQKGDLSSYAFLIDKYKNMAYTIAVRILGDAADAEDAAQDSFIKAYLQIGSFGGKSKFSTWLYTIVYRTAISKLHAGKNRFVPIDDEIAEHYESQNIPGPAEQMQTAERDQFIKEAISRLPKMESLVITLFYINENTIDEITEITGLTHSNIKVKLFRARKILEKELHFLM